MSSDLVIILPGQREVKLRATHPLTKEDLKPRSIDWVEELVWVKRLKEIVTRSVFHKYETPLPRKPPEHAHSPS